MNYQGNPMLQQLGQGQPTTQTSIVDQARKIAQTIESSKNPGALLNYFGAANPDFKEAMNLVGPGGGSLKSIFYAMAKRKGVNPDEIISPLKYSN